jgi:hypothetical protein
MKTMDIGILNKMMDPNNAFSVMVSEVGKAELSAMEELIEAIEEQICLPRNISVMELFSLWEHMDPIYV